ncbi:MAG: 16S rRNA (adenine(1518)-N(6)/adenine(1519)-N(6))-dimethyltransferase RsmA [Methylocystaceae bacterium]
MHNPGTIGWTKELLHNYNLTARKQWGQNFLVDRNILQKIAQAAELVPGDTVVEIGTGLGALTIELAERAGRVITVEVDQRLAPLHEEVFAPFSNITKVEADILKTDLEELVRAVTGVESAYKVCANLPYYITSPILFALLEQCPSLQNAVLMMQREVAMRLMAPPGSPDYGILTVMANYYARFTTVCQVGHNCFYPKPEIESTVVKLEPILADQRIEVGDVKIFKRLVKTGFNQRRKMLVNTLAAGFNLTKDEVRYRLLQCEIKETIRPEQLSLSEWARLSLLFH